MKNFLALLVFAGGFAGWYLYHQKQEVEESLASTEIHEKEAAIKRAEFQSLNGVMAIRKKAAEKQAELTQLRNQLKTLRDAKDAVARERQQTLAAIRQTFAGKTIPLKLTTGRDLGQVRIMKADDTGVTVALPSGVQKVPPQELPQDLKQALNY
jgi:hypothetical protein